MTLKTPGGNPARRESSASANAVKGVSAGALTWYDVTVGMDEGR